MTSRSLMEYGDFLTVDEVCSVLQLSKNTVYELVRIGDLPTVRLGRQLRTPRAALERMMVHGTERGVADV